MPGLPEDLIGKLRRAAQDVAAPAPARPMGDGVDRAQVDDVVAEMTGALRTDPGGFTETHVFAAARVLRRRRLFGALERLVEAYLAVARRPATRMVRTLYAQALVDQDQLTAALDVLLPLAEEPPGDDKAAEEARGLVGRVHKQAFVRAGGPLPWHGAEALRLALAAYADAQARARLDRLWPGVNLVALACRAAADHVDSPVAVDVPGLSRQLLEGAEAALEAGRLRAMNEGRDPVDEPWAVATALEAAIALDDDEAAVAWGRRYLACEQADAFELASTHRQLTEIWRLHERKGRKAAVLVPLLEAELLRRKPGAILQGAVGMRAVEVDGVELQSVWGVERFQTWQWMKRAVRCSDAVGQVQDVNGNPVGSGFLVPGRSLRLDWADQAVFLTNRHVVDDPPKDEPPEPGEKRGVLPSRARIQFTALKGAPTVEVKSLRWRSGPPHAALDAVVLELGALPEGGEPLDLGDIAGLRTDGPEPSRIFVIGHPKGAALSYSMYGNELRELDPPHLYYRSPTEEGSSGSPVFNPDFFLVGIHHGAVPAKAANRGTLIEAVRKAVAG